jgi:hypothetical protein
MRDSTNDVIPGHRAVMNPESRCWLARFPDVQLRIVVRADARPGMTVDYRNIPPVFLLTSVTILAATASIS